VIRNFIHLETETHVQDFQGGDCSNHLLGCDIT